jgi:hypothetical protein
MAELKYDYPLTLPSGWVSASMNARGINPAFPRSTSIAEALRYLEDETRHLPTAHATLYSNYQHVANERLRKKIGNDGGATLRFRCYDREHTLACDHWQTVEQNIYALHLALRALRNFEEWGVSTFEYALSLFSGNLTTKETASPAPGGEISLPAWMLALGIGPGAALEDANAVYRRRAKEISGDEEALLALNQAIEEARRHLR